MARWFVDRSAQRGIPSVHLRNLLPDATFIGCHDLPVCGCSSEVRWLEPGQVFISMGTGDRDDVRRAIEKGAAAVVLETPSPEAGRPQVVVPNARRALGKLCQALAGDPSEQLSLVAVTGASGKTAICHYLRAIEEAAGGRCGFVGSDGWSDGVTSHPAGASAPKAEALARMLTAMLETRCRSGVVAAPAEDWDADRLEGITFDAAVIADAGPSGTSSNASNPTRRGHARAFRRIVPGGVAVVHADDPEADLMGAVNLDASRVSFALGRSDDVDVSGWIERLDPSGTVMRLQGFEREQLVHLRLIGSRHALHALAAASVARALGFRLDTVVAGLEAVERIPGRLDRVILGQPFEVRVDRARTPGALEYALIAMREVSRGKVHCLLGASGDTARDAAVARVVEERADTIVASLDRPTIFDHDRVLDGLLASFRKPGRVRVEPDRRRAIEAILDVALPGDAVLLAGDSPFVDTIADRLIPRDDRELAAQWARANGQRPGRKSA
jgi:UDP-N-acetylmuramoyl-L-alanyl-D-glutamate--2,6-diaminopimelate ligase